MHVCRTDDARTDEERHDPQAHDDVPDELSQEQGHLLRGIQFHFDSGLALEVFLQGIFHERGKINCFIDCGIDLASSLSDLTANIHFFKGVLADPRRRDLHHIDLRADLGQNALHVIESPPQHGHAVREPEPVLFHDLQDLHKEVHDINTAQGHLPISFDQSAQFRVQTAVVYFARRLAQLDHGALESGNIAHGDGSHSAFHQILVSGGKSPHHSHVDPDDLTLVDLNVPRVRVSMEETVFHDLLDVVVDQFAADLLQIISPAEKMFSVIDGTAADILHDEDTAGSVFTVEMGHADIFDPGIVAGKLLHIGCLFKEIHFLLRDCPHFIQNHPEIYDVLNTADRGHQPHQTMQEADIPGHSVINPLALHLDHDVLAGQKPCPVRLRDRSRPQWFFVYVRKDLVPVLTVGAVDDLFHLLEGHGSHLRIELHQFFTVGPGEDVGVQGHDLAELDISGPQFLQNDTEFLRGHPSCNMIPEKDLPDLLHPAPVVHLCLLFHVSPLFPLCIVYNPLCADPVRSFSMQAKTRQPCPAVPAMLLAGPEVCRQKPASHARLFPRCSWPALKSVDKNEKCPRRNPALLPARCGQLRSCTILC